KDLISDVNGTLSGEARIGGTPGQANFQGKGRLENVQFKVQYLNTAYKLNGPIQIEKSKLIFRNLDLKDLLAHSATVNGSIDLKRPVNPLIDVVIDAQNLLALNTTFQQNPLYYGTAYGTGRFQFAGTPESMRIS